MEDPRTECKEIIARLKEMRVSLDLDNLNLTNFRTGEKDYPGKFLE